MSGRKLQWMAWLLLVGSVPGALHGVEGYVLAGSSTISNPESLARWQPVAPGYGVTILACLLLAVRLTVHLVGTRQRSY